ncbi:MAG: P-loop NTPase fold protein [Paracoccaceae bacterium]
MEAPSPPGAHEAIRLYLDSANITFVIGVEPEVVRTGIRRRYKDNATLAGKEYLEKIVQLTFVMRGLDHNAAMELIGAYAKTADYVYDEIVIDMILTATEANPRRIKRLINTFYVLAQMHLASGGQLGSEDVQRLALALCWSDGTIDFCAKYSAPPPSIVAVNQSPRYCALSSAIFGVISNDQGHQGGLPRRRHGHPLPARHQVHAQGDAAAG